MYWALIIIAIGGQAQPIMFEHESDCEAASTAIQLAWKTKYYAATPPLTICVATDKTKARP